MIASDADILAVFTSLLQYRLYSEAQFSASISAGQFSSLTVSTALKLTPSETFISQLAKPQSPSPVHDSAHASATYLLGATTYNSPAKDISPFAAFVTEHYFISILATQVVGASLRLHHGLAENPAARHAFIRSDLTISALRCLAFLASNISMPHVFLRSELALAPSSGVATCLRGFSFVVDAERDRFAADSPQARLQSLEQLRASLAGDLSPVDLLNMLCDEHTSHVMTTTDVVTACDSGGTSIKRCALGRILLMEPFLMNAITFILHNASALQQIPRFGVVSSHAILGTRVELGRCSGIVSASFCWDGPSIADGGVKHHSSVFTFFSHNTVDCELMCLSLLMSAAEGGHGWFTHSAGGGSQFYSARGCILALTNFLSRAAPFLQKTQQPGAPTSSDALHLSLQQSSPHGRALSSDPNAQLIDRPHTPRTPRSKRDITGDVPHPPPHFLTNLQTESFALVMSQ